MKLTAENVDTVFKYCLYDSTENVDKNEDDIPVGAKVAEGVMTRVAFDPSRLERRREDIKSLLDQIKPEFHLSGGGGWSFPNLCEDREGNQWTGLQQTCDLLVCLALASGMGEFPMPRNLWEILPGGVPYVTFDTSIG